MTINDRVYTMNIKAAAKATIIIKMNLIKSGKKFGIKRKAKNTNVCTRNEIRK